MQLSISEISFILKEKKILSGGGEGKLDTYKNKIMIFKIIFVRKRK